MNKIFAKNGETRGFLTSDEKVGGFGVNLSIKLPGELDAETFLKKAKAKLKKDLDTELAEYKEAKLKQIEGLKFQ